jgi:hypothetical protein
MAYEFVGSKADPCGISGSGANTVRRGAVVILPAVVRTPGTRHAWASSRCAAIRRPERRSQLADNLETKIRKNPHFGGHVLA